MLILFISYSDTYQCGGWGHAIGDEGSAFFIAYSAVKTVFDHEDNLVKSPYDISTAWNLIKDHFQISNRTDMLEHCYAKFQKPFYARLCMRIAEAAKKGDELCKHIFMDAGRLLAKMILALLPKISPELVKTGHLSVICIGSVWLSWNLLKPGFIKALHEHDIPFELRLLKLQPGVSMAVGSVYMAADFVKFSLPRDYSKNYEIFFNYGAKHESLNGNCICCNINNNNNHHV